MTKNPYEVLGLKEGASMDEIKRAYRRMAKANHPDLHPNDPNANERMQQINEAYDMLCNPEKYQTPRAEYADRRQQGYASGWSAYGARQERPYRQYTYYYTTGSDRNPWGDRQEDEPMRPFTGIFNPFRSIFRVIGGLLLFRFALTLLRFGLFGFFF